jgi:hypothetical protein
VARKKVVEDKACELRPGLCYSDCLVGCAGMVHIGRKMIYGGEVSLCNRPVFLFTGWRRGATYCPDCEAVNGGPVLKPAQGSLF